PEPQAVARVFTLRPRVRPVCDLVPIDPGREVVAVCDERHREPLAVGRDDLPGWLSAVDRPGAEIDRLGAVVVLPLVANLHLVALLILVRQAAEEDAAIEVVAVGDALALEDEVGKGLFRLQIAGAVLDTDSVVAREGRDGKLRLVARAGEDFPSGEVFAIVERF